MKRMTLRFSVFVTISLMLVACGGGSSKSTLTDSELDRVRSDPRVVRLIGIVERSDTLLIPSIQGRYSFSIQGQTESDRLVEHFSCAGTRCVNQRDNTEISIEDLFDPSTNLDIDLMEVSLGPRGGFDTVTTRGKFDLSNSFPGVTVTATPSAFSYGFWGEHGFAAVEITDGPFSGRTQGVSFRGDISVAAAYVVGNATGTNPTGMGRATWSGIAEAASTRTFQRRQGTATVSIADLSRPRVGVEIDISGFAIGSSAWADIPLANGRFTSRTIGSDHLQGDFHGPNHSEAYGVFDTGAYVGAFGGKRDQ